MKGIILAGGRGSRLYPITLGACKQLLPVFDKPMIYYPLSVLMQANIREILIISTPEDLPRFQRIFGSGNQLGLSFSYTVQPQPQGIAQAFILGADFIGEDTVCLILGDNIFYGHQLPQVLESCHHLEKGGIIFGYEVKDPERYGVIEFIPNVTENLGLRPSQSLEDGRSQLARISNTDDVAIARAARAFASAQSQVFSHVRYNEKHQIKTIIEKPKIPPSSYAVTGLYFYDNDVIEMARSLTPSGRGELEITDVNNIYLERGDLHVRLLERGFAWLDTGTHDALQKASSYVQTIQERQGIKIACIEEIAYMMGFISLEALEALSAQASSSEYGAYLSDVYKKIVLSVN